MPAAPQRATARLQQPPVVTAVLNILRTAAWLLDELEPTFAAHHLTAARFDVLDALAQLGQPVRPAELKERLHVPGQTLTGVLDALERAGHVRRIPNPRDRRSVLVEITPAGRAAFATVCPDLVAVEEACLSELKPADLARLTRMLSTIQATIARARSLED